MKIFVNKIHCPVTVLGYGRRIGIWFQGCGIHCAGCLSRDTWQQTQEYETTVEEVLSICDSMSVDGIDGITITGGERFDQPDALGALLHGLVEMRGRRGDSLDLLVYSGRPLRLLLREFESVLSFVDAIIAEPFIAAQAPGMRWRGSANQTITRLTELGERRYGATAPCALRTDGFQLAVDNNVVWLIGIPGPGDMQEIERAAERRGLKLGEASWHA